MNDIMPNMCMVLPGDYCNKCDEFAPEVLVEDMWAGNKVVCTSRSIVCKNEALCRHLIRFLQSEVNLNLSIDEYECRSGRSSR